MKPLVLFYYVYPNMEWKYNLVEADYVDEHIEYNKALRPGRIMYKEDPDSEQGFVRIHNGMFRESALEKYDQQAAKFFKNEHFSRTHATIPYC